MCGHFFVEVMELPMGLILSLAHNRLEQKVCILGPPWGYSSGPLNEGKGSQNPPQITDVHETLALLSQPLNAEDTSPILQLLKV